MLEKTNPHTILRLPTGIFYKPGVKASVIFFDNKLPNEHLGAKEFLVYEFRTGSIMHLKRIQ